MKNLIVCICLMFSIISAKAQSFETQIDEIAIKLIEQLNKKRKIKKVGVADFTFVGESNTRIGKYIADEISLSLTMNGADFTMINREKVRKELAKEGKIKKEKIDIGGFSDVINKEETETKEEQTEDLFNTGANLAGSLFKSKKILKEANAIIFGTIEDKGDYLRVIIEVAKNAKKGGNVAAARGNLIKTPEIVKMLGDRIPEVKVEIPEKEIFTTKGINSNEIMPMFKYANFQFEVQGCSQRGKEIECTLSVVSQEKDAYLRVYLERSRRYTRIIDAESGYEYKAVEVKIADITSTRGRAEKSLVADFPVVSKLIFKNVNKKIKSISRMDINCYSFIAKLENITVN